jgi:hypothetical protein
MKSKIEIIYHHINPNGKGGLAVIANHYDGDSFWTMWTVPCSRNDQYRRKQAVEMLQVEQEMFGGARIPFIDHLVTGNPRRHTGGNALTHGKLRNLVINMVYSQ